MEQEIEVSQVHSLLMRIQTVTTASETLAHEPLRYMEHKIAGGHKTGPLTDGQDHKEHEQVQIFRPETRQSLIFMATTGSEVLIQCLEPTTQIDGRIQGLPEEEKTAATTDQGRCIHLTDQGDGNNPMYLHCLGP